MSSLRLIGPIFFEGTITLDKYRNEILSLFTNQRADDEPQVGYFQQDGATSHVTHENIQQLTRFFADRIISRSTAIPYPPRSCDLTVTDVFMWPYIKNTIYETPINNLDELRHKIIEKCEQ